MHPDTRYTQSGDVTIAYQVVGEGPFDLVVVPGFISHLEQDWEDPAYARFLGHLSSFCRLIRFDKRGTGLSDRLTSIPTLEERSDDVRAVMDAAGSKRADIVGYFRRRTDEHCLCCDLSRADVGPHPLWQHRARRLGHRLSLGRSGGCSIRGLARLLAQRLGRANRNRLLGAVRRERSALSRMVVTISASCSEPQFHHCALPHEQGYRRSAILPTIHVPTLVIHRTDDRAIHIEEGRYLARHIEGARIVELDGEDHLWWVGDSAAIVSEIEQFMTGRVYVAEIDRVLATVLFTDIVDLTARAAQIGDRAWRDLLDNHNNSRSIGCFF